MRRAAGAGDDDLEAGRLGALGKGKQPVRGAVRRNDALFAVDAERGQRVGGMAHGIPVRLASHDDGDGAVMRLILSGIQKHRPDYRIGPKVRQGVARGPEWTILSW